MNRILLAYSHDNAALARQLDQKLSRIGIPFEHISDQAGVPAGTFADHLRVSGEPVLLLVTDNLMKNRDCMTDLLPVLQTLVQQQKVLVVLANGINAEGEVVETHIDRMVNALQYMNYWQNIWLDLSTVHQEAAAGDKDMLNERLDQVRSIANQMGDVIATLREAHYVTQEQLEAQDFAVFFQKFGLSDWHGQYRRLAVLEQETTDAEPAATTIAEVPAVSGLLAPTPAETATLTALPEEAPVSNAPAMPETPAITEDQSDYAVVETLEPLRADTAPIESTPSANHTTTALLNEIETTVRDAWFWLERGHTERGLELFQLAMEQHPEHQGLQRQYALALEQYQAAPDPRVAQPDQPHPVDEPGEEPVAPPAPAPEPEAGVEQPVETPAALPSQVEEPAEARSYDLMGDMAQEKGDYLFAKYCWDRAAELDPDYPNIYRKLGLMTSEYLRDYRETAVHYLSKALEISPNDAEVHLAFAKLSLQNDQAIQAEGWYQRAVSLQPALRNEEYDRLFAPIAPPETRPVEMPAEETASVVTAPGFQPGMPPREVLTVLVTGATSGIGRVTAALFARHGHRVILTGRRLERLVLLRTQLETELHTDVLMLPFDVRDAGAVTAALNNLPEGWQNIDILINNAGLAKGLAPVQEGELDHWETMIDTNVKGLLYVTRAISPGMVARRRGHIINVGSSAGKEVYPNGNVYCATKFAVDALTRSMRLDLYQHNIRVSQVSPGHVEDTEFALNRFDGDAERARIYDDFQPLRPDDVAEVIYFMATRPAHVNVQDVVLFSTQQASATAVDRSGRGA